MKPKLLIADDEIDLLAELRPFLERSGYQVISADNGEDALTCIAREHPDLVVLDLLMPKLDGRDVLRRLRQTEDWTPVILLTKVNSSAERVLSLQEGADDYLNKPFEPLELLARVQAILRRVQRGSPSLAGSRRLVCRTLILDRQSRQVSLNARTLNLTTRAVGVLEFLMLHPLESISRQRVLDDVWGWSYATETRAVDIRISEIRRALQDDADAPDYIETVVGYGYRFLGEVRGDV